MTVRLDGTTNEPGPAPIRLVAVGVADLPSEQGIAVTVDGRDLAVFVVDGEPVVYDGRCRHRGGPVGEGYVRDGVVTCPLHWWRYDLHTGGLIGDPTIRLERYPTEIVDGDVVVTVPATHPTDPETSIRERLLARARAASAVPLSASPVPLSVPIEERP